MTILILLGVCIIILSYSQRRDLQYNKNTLVWPVKLIWDDERLTLSSKLHNNSGQEGHENLPAIYSPLFFQKIPINQAGYGLLLTIQGIGPKTATQILDLRSRLGKINGPEELLAIKGIGKKRAQSLDKQLSFE